MDIKEKMNIDKACQETLAKYGKPQVAEAIKQLIRSDNPNYFTGVDNKENMSEINKEELCGFMLASLVEGRVLKENKHYALLLALKPERLDQMSADEVELYVRNRYANGDIVDLQELTKSGIERNDRYVDSIVNAFLHFRYESHNLSPQELLAFETQTSDGIEIANNFHAASEYQLSNISR